MAGCSVCPSNATTERSEQRCGVFEDQTTCEASGCSYSAVSGCFGEEASLRNKLNSSGDSEEDEASGIDVTALVIGDDVLIGEFEVTPPRRL